MDDLYTLCLEYLMEGQLLRPWVRVLMAMEEVVSGYTNN